MNTQLHSFIGLFNSEFSSDNKTVQLKEIIIPKIQRDYAQGRIDSDTVRVRTRFLESLYKALTDVPITLDFVYGDIDNQGVMRPLDGQQRLTTLFLLHWYAAKKEGIDPQKYAFLKNFSYDTRYSARQFCKKLVKFDPSFETPLSVDIINQSWFPLEWKKDSTIRSMLTMIDAIAEKCHDVDDLWNRLENNAITFYFLPIKNMGLTDELYIKMNSRGKPLTQFEHFKAELQQQLQLISEPLAKCIIRKIDIDWTDMLWRYRGVNQITDDEFLRYYRFLCDIITYKNGDTTQGKDNNEFTLLKEYFSPENDNAIENISFLEQAFDCWKQLPAGLTPNQFFEQFTAYNYEPGKIKTNSPRIDLFGDCLENYIDEEGRRTRAFPLSRFLLLYTFLTYLINQKSITEKQFIRRLRIVNNLIQNSSDEITENPSRQSGNTMPALIRQIDSLIINGVFLESIGVNFNQNQISEEIEKSNWLNDNSDIAEDLFRLEDHELLYGQISIVGLDHPDYFRRFDSLFSCNRDLVDCVLLTVGNYSLREKNGKRYQLGTRTNRTSWRELFHKSSNPFFENTKSVLVDLLSRYETFTDDLLGDLKQNYLSNSEAACKYDWRYYYVKYDTFRPNKYGKYWWEDFAGKPYEVLVMQTQFYLSVNSYQPFLQIADPKNISKDDFGQRIILGENYIECHNSEYLIKDTFTESLIRSIPISQNSEGIDTENRIGVLMEILSEMKSHTQWET